MKKNPKISIIIPAYNVSKYIKECIVSILSQSYENFEIIVIDDGSSDNTYNICNVIAEHDKRVCLFSQMNSGVSSARNNGISKISGEYVMFVDGDDVLLDCDTLSACVEILSADNDLDFVQFPLHKFFDHYDNRKLTTPSKQIINISGEKNIYEAMFLKDVLNGFLCGKCYRRRVIRENCMRKGFSLGEDALFFLDNIHILKKAAVINQGLYGYRQVESSGSRTWNIKTAYQLCIAIISEYTAGIKYNIDAADLMKKKERVFHGLGDLKSINGITDEEFDQYARVLIQNPQQFDNKSNDKWLKLSNAIGIKGALMLYVLSSKTKNLIINKNLRFNFDIKSIFLNTNSLHRGG